jgi:hypothetical protein
MKVFEVTVRSNNEDEPFVEADREVVLASSIADVFKHITEQGLDAICIIELRSVDVSL